METTVRITCNRVLVLHMSVWSQCVHKMDSSELGVLLRPGVGEVQQGWQLCCHSPLLTAGRTHAHGLSSPELLQLLQTSLYTHLRASVQPLNTGEPWLALVGLSKRIQTGQPHFSEYIKSLECCEVRSQLANSLSLTPLS